ncbi:Vta1 like-domain-containing protein [Cadophora sp. MPI-SDFR-AT-0126]|nr:Vta1 like-domain-containing protein [Leotiomycetes sp. MPI-SDFR-AT-0126]
MAVHIPAKLKAADLSRFIIRASQLETAKPVIAYWCEYWIVNQILSKGLHNGDAETLQYTTTLMDKLEQIKANNATNDAIVDDTAGQAYVEHFGLETFFRADRTVKANAVTKQTADTFQAAATFLELVNIWGSPDADTTAKIKYAKWNAIRIMKALKEGKDPNESNPKIEPAEETLPALDPNDPEVLSLGGESSKQPSVEDVPDEQFQVESRLARQSSIDQSLHPSAQPSAQVSARGSPGPNPTFDPYPKDGFPYSAVKDDNVSPLEPSPNERDGSVGGGYFPEVPTFTSETQDSTLGTAPPADALDLGLPDHPSAPPGGDLGLPEQPKSQPGVQRSPDFESFPPPTLPDEPSNPPQDFYRQAPTQPPPPQFSHPRAQQPANYAPPPVQPQQPIYQAPPPQAQRYNPLPPDPPAPKKTELITDDQSIAKAQKHCRWAISALNFEDANTAVRELREALKTLGAL